MFPQTLVVLLVVAHLGFGAKVVIDKPRFRRNVCASTSSGNMTVINYPGTNGDYLNNAYCDWSVCTNTSSASVRISRMDIELHPRCSYDAVSIQGVKYCGRNARDLNVPTSNGCISVRFTSDGSVRGSGFRLEVRTGQVNTTSVSNLNSTFNSSSGNSPNSTFTPSNSSGNSTLNTGSSNGNFSFGNNSSSNGNSSGNSTVDTGSYNGNFSFSNNSMSNGNSSGNSTIDTGTAFGNFSFGNNSSSNGNSSGNSTIDTGSSNGNFSFGNNSSSNGNSSGNSTIDTGSSNGNFSFSNNSSSNGNSSGNSTTDTGTTFGNFSFGNNSSSNGNSSGNSTIDTGSSFGNFSFSNNSSSNGNSSGNSTIDTGSSFGNSSNSFGNSSNSFGNSSNSFGNSSSGNQSLFNSCVLARSVGNMTEEIDYPGTGNYPNNAFCQWNVCTNTAQARISITKIDIEAHPSCSYDSLKIQNSKYCGLSPGSFTVSTNQGCVQVGFTSDFSVTQTGFTLGISPA